MLQVTIRYKMTKVPSVNYPDIFYTGPTRESGDGGKVIRRKTNDILTWSLAGGGHSILLTGDEFRIPEVSSSASVVTAQDKATTRHENDEKVDAEKSGKGLPSDEKNVNGFEAEEDKKVENADVVVPSDAFVETTEPAAPSMNGVPRIPSPQTQRRTSPLPLRKPYKSAECLDQDEPSTVAGGSGGVAGPKVKFKTPLSKIKFYRTTSDTHLNKVGLNGTNQDGGCGGGQVLGEGRMFASQPFIGQKRVAPTTTATTTTAARGGADFLEKERTHVEMLKCIRGHDCKTLKSMLKKRNVDVNLSYGEHGPLIHEAAYTGCTKCIKAVLKAGSYVNLCDAHGWTALHAAVLGSNLDAIRVLLANNALANQVNQAGLSPFHLAVLSNDLNVVHEMVKGGGDPLAAGGDVTPFQLAIDMKKGAALDYFLHMPCLLVGG